MNWFFAYVAIGWIIRGGMLLTVLRRTYAPGASIAWLLIVFLHPYIGLGLYQMFGEKRLGPGRVLHHDQLRERYTLADPKCDLPADLPECCREQSRLALKVGHMPPVNGSTVEFLTESSVMISRLSADIDAAKSHVHLLYYIFTPDASGMKIADAMIRAAQRGVKCRLILDQYASRACFRRHGFASQLQAAGIEVVAALPSSPLRRRDLRNHRKLAIIDDRVAYAGSQNLINPDYGGKRGGPWVDLSGRFTGPIVAEYATVFLIDWAFETNRELPAPSIGEIATVANGDPMQVVPTGPVSSAESFRRLFLGAIESAREQIVLTTPYFVPDEATILALPHRRRPRRGRYADLTRKIRQYFHRRRRPSTLHHPPPGRHLHLSVPPGTHPRQIHHCGRLCRYLRLSQSRRPQLQFEFRAHCDALLQRCSPTAARHTPNLPPRLPPIAPPAMDLSPGSEQICRRGGGVDFPLL